MSFTRVRATSCLLSSLLASAAKTIQCNEFTSASTETAKYLFRLQVGDTDETNEWRRQQVAHESTPNKVQRANCKLKSEGNQAHDRIRVMLVSLGMLAADGKSPGACQWLPRGGGGGDSLGIYLSEALFCIALGVDRLGAQPAQLPRDA